MIDVVDLSKAYGDTLAIDRISFRVEEGEVVGFLGPNGAGKTTMMRVLTGFVPATSGRATVAGCDVSEDSLGVRRHVGYLPESVPLYPEMRVREYLAFRAKLKGVRWRERTARIGDVMERCALREVAGRLVGHLSKGYRQRVGLADALVGDPKILILDEPTVGLDPNQIRQARGLIKDLGRRHTVLLSTHILPEVEMICGRVIIVSRGRIAAQDSLAALTRARGLKLEVKGTPAAVRDALAKVPGIRKIDVTEGPAVQAVRVEFDEGRDPREEVGAALAARGLLVLEMARTNRTLEEVFVNLTMGEEAAP